MRFRPSSGMGPNQNQNQKRNDRAAQEARAEAIGERPDENVYERGRFSKEIDRAENIAAGLPPEGDAPAATPESGKKDFREPHMDTPAEVKEEAYTPVPITEPRPQGIIEHIKATANKVIQKVHRFIKPVQRSNK